MRAETAPEFAREGLGPFNEEAEGQAESEAIGST